ncbi:MAG: hypothetical protein IJK87_00515 [Prevotella sp.]|nr:hypothetical protein [Prevotella sp.]
MAVLALVAKCLLLDFREVGGLVVFQFDHADDISVDDDGTVSLLGVGLILPFGDEVVVGRWIERIAQHIDKQLAKKSLLELLFLAFANVGLYVGVMEIGLERPPSLVGLPCR